MFFLTKRSSVLSICPMSSHCICSSALCLARGQWKRIIINSGQSFHGQDLRLSQSSNFETLIRATYFRNRCKYRSDAQDYLGTKRIACQTRMRLSDISLHVLCMPNLYPLRTDSRPPHYYWKRYDNLSLFNVGTHYTCEAPMSASLDCMLKPRREIILRKGSSPRWTHCNTSHLSSPSYQQRSTIGTQKFCYNPVRHLILTSSIAFYSGVVRS